MDIQNIVALIGAVIAGMGGVWAVWRLVQPYLPADSKRDALIDSVIRRMHSHTMPGDQGNPSVPDRATALQYTEAVLRYMEKHGSVEGVNALVTVLSEIASPTTPKE